MNQSTPNVRPFFHEPTGTWSYLVSHDGHAVIIDPVLDYDAPSATTSTDSVNAIIEAARAAGFKLDWILETHAHADHLSAAPVVKAALGGEIVIGEGIRRVQSHFKPVFALPADFPCDGSQFDRLLNDGDTLPFGDLRIEAIATPGHTSDSLSYHIGDALFVGDTLFMPDGGSARCDFPGGDAALLYRSIQRLYTLPDDTRVFVCHDYAPGGREVACETSIGEQKRANIHLNSGVSEAEFVERRTARDRTLGMPKLILPSIQINIRAGRLPEPDAQGHRYLTLPLNRF